MRIWTLGNQKGGVGKTTSVVGLGGLLASWGFRTLLVDLDPHGSLTSYFKYDPDSLDGSVYSLFKAQAEGKTLEPDRLLYRTGTEGLELMPAVMALATLDRLAGGLDGLGLVISSALDRLRGRFDYVLIDCPPVLGILMVNALAACQTLIIPVQTEFLALKGLERMLRSIKMVSKARRSDLSYLIVPTLFDRRTRASIDSLRTLRATYPEHIWSGVVPIDTLFREASKAGIPPAIFAPGMRGMKAYGLLLDDLQRMEADRNIAMRATA